MVITNTDGDILWTHTGFRAGDEIKIKEAIKENL
jgi:hypothetical protein